MKTLRWVFMFVATITISSAIVFAKPLTAEASGGTILDGYQRDIVGVWVEVQDGQSGWAQFRPTISGQNYSVWWRYNTQNKNFRLHIGVGGTPQNWQYNVKTTWLWGNKNNFNTIILNNWLGVPYAVSQ